LKISEFRDRDTLELRLPATPAAVPAARKAVGRLAEQHGFERSPVELAVAEAVANAVLHAFPEGAPGEVVVRASATARDLAVEVGDNGFGMRARSERHGLGLGLPLIKDLAREFSLGRSTSGGTLVSMRFEQAS
jgi:anti-sigma regulatory factor (Ser/Thr protein kinase)